MTTAMTMTMTTTKGVMTMTKQTRIPVSRQAAGGKTPARKKRGHPALGARIAVAGISTTAMLIMVTVFGYRAANTPSIAPVVTAPAPAPVTIIIHRPAASTSTIAASTAPTEPLNTDGTLLANQSSPPMLAASAVTPPPTSVKTSTPTAVASTPTASAPVAPATTAPAGPVMLDATPTVVTVVETVPTTQTSGS